MSHAFKAPKQKKTIRAGSSLTRFHHPLIKSGLLKHRRPNASVISCRTLAITNQRKEEPVTQCVWKIPKEGYEDLRRSSRHLWMIKWMNGWIMDAGAIIRLGRISPCSGEAGWVILGSVDLQLGTDPGMPPTESSCQLLYMFSFLLFFFFSNYRKDSRTKRIWQTNENCWHKKVL